VLFTGVDRVVGSHQPERGDTTCESDDQAQQSEKNTGNSTDDTHEHSRDRGMPQTHRTTDHPPT
jgi:hypothetical protein